LQLYTQIWCHKNARFRPSGNLKRRPLLADSSATASGAELSLLFFNGLEYKTKAAFDSGFPIAHSSSLLTKIAHHGVPLVVPDVVREPAPGVVPDPEPGVRELGPEGFIEPGVVPEAPVP
jgi:hypothetical protein